MIQARSHYLRKKGRKFWTESFVIDTKSVPGFLSELSESILQCGKTLRLLKICSPKVIFRDRSLLVFVDLIANQQNDFSMFLYFRIPCAMCLLMLNRK